MNKFYFFLFFCVCGLLSAQEKAEKEERIPFSEFPEVTEKYFNFLFEDLKYLKFYKETKGDTISFEAKFKVADLHYNVKFDSIGQLENVEIVIKKKIIPDEVLTKIETYLDTTYRFSRMIEIKKQFRNELNLRDKHFIKYVVKKTDRKHSHYAIIAEIKTKNKHELREFTFDRHGVYETWKPITSSTYEHTLY